jgi:hypothetical protein
VSARLLSVDTVRHSQPDPSVSLIGSLVARLTESPDAELERALDEIFGRSARKEREARHVAYLNRRFVRPLFHFPSHE